ncbi:MAG: hypothetical protein U0570_10955 [Phycisphaerales bacterium]
MTHQLSAAAVLTLLSGVALAGISQSSVPFPGGYGQAAAFSLTTGSATAGGDLATMMGVPQDFEEAAFAPNASTARSASYDGGGIANSVSATFGFGYVTVAASNQSPDAAYFPGAFANGGWKDTFTVSHPSLNGQGGFLVFRVRGKGSMHTTGLTGSAIVYALPYKDNVVLAQNMYFDRGDSDLVSTTDQYARWGLASFGGTDSRNFDGVTTMSAPFTFGVSFSLGVYALAGTGQRSSGGVGGNGSATMQSQLNWDGLIGVFTQNGPVSGATIVTGSGTDFGPSAAPCPADLNGDGLVEDADFSLFAGAYNILDCADPAMPAGCPADVNGDGFVDDADFVLFVSAYNELLCP